MLRLSHSVLIIVLRVLARRLLRGLVAFIFNVMLTSEVVKTCPVELLAP
jgi:hypothetical protein